MSASASKRQNQFEEIKKREKELAVLLMDRNQSARQ
jgi:hypothetical protein